MKKITITILSLLLVMGCAQSGFQRNTELEDSIYSLVEDINISEININSLTNIDWDRAFLFEPYSPQETIMEQLGVSFEDPSKINTRDDLYLLVFIDDDKVVYYAELIRQQTDFSIGEGEYLTPFNDSIKIERK